MEASMIASFQMKTTGRSVSCGNEKQFIYCNLRNFRSFCQSNSLVLARSKKNCSVGFSSKASQLSPIVAVHKDPVVNPSSSPIKSKSVTFDSGRLYVALPLDLISECHTINHIKAIATGLKALKLLGIDGVELPIWWSLVEKKAGDYNWSAYLALAELVHNMGFKIHASFHFNASKEAKIPLPEFVSKIGESNPNVFFTDKSGRRYKECLSLSVDELPVLDGRTPVQAYQELLESFKLTFGSLDNHATNRNGVGEFQCYDEYTLLDLKQHGESTSNPLWGLGGPHDAPSYNESPTAGNFFKDEGGSWETLYGDFFLSWYSDRLVSHGDRLLSMASRVFSDTKVVVSGKIPIEHGYSGTRSHPCELTSGFYNTVNRNGYEAVARMLAKNSADLVVPGMDLLDGRQGSNSRPKSLVEMIKETCGNNGVGVIGQNSVVSSAEEGMKQIKKNLIEGDGVVDQFIYQRMGAEFFSPKNFSLFTELVRGLSSQPEMHSDDLPAARSRSNAYAQHAA
ncbi:LOW QUALITY PROTEIN: hypothetical protein V2J09_013432 [Rumex salicifolius]